MPELSQPREGTAALGGGGGAHVGGGIADTKEGGVLLRGWFVQAITCASACILALLVYAHTCIGSRMMVDGQAPMGLLTPHVASADNLWSAVATLSAAGCVFYTIIVACLSGAWPYVKLLLTLLVTHMLSSRTMTLSAGHRWLGVLETLGKYSFADAFLIAFNYTVFNIQTEKYSIMFQTLQIRLWMNLAFPALALIVAVSCSAFLTQLVIVNLPEEAPRYPSKHISVLRCLAVVLPIIGIAALLLGDSLTLCRVSRGGFFGMLIAPEERDLTISVFSMFTKMCADGGLTAVFGVVVAILAFGGPLAEFVFLFGARIAPRPVADASYRLAGWMNSINGVEMMAFCAWTLTIDMKPAVKFNMGEECKPFEAIMNNKAILNVAGLGFAASSECFDPQATLHVGFVFLLVCVVIRIISWQVIKRVMALSSEPLLENDPQADAKER